MDEVRLEELDPADAADSWAERLVHEGMRGRGCGARLMRAGAHWAKAHGSHAIGLNVFAHNPGARRLYDRLGYHVVEEYLAKELA